MPSIVPSEVQGQHNQINNAPVNPTPPIGTDAAQAAPSPPDTDPSSAKFLELARRAKVQRQRELKIQSERQAFERQQQEFQSRQKEYETNYIPKDRIRTDLIGVLSEAGLDMQQIANLIQNPAVSLDLEIKALKKELAELKGFNEQSSKAAQENQSSQYEQAVNQIRFDTKNIVNTDPRFETVKELGQQEAVVELIKQTFESGMGSKYPKGTVLNIEDAAILVEEQLLEDALKMAALPKVKQKQAPVAEAPVAPSSGVQKIIPNTSKNTYSIKTLTNTMAAGSERSNSFAEKRARAIARLEGREV